MKNSLRQIVLDTETTGIGHELGHRIIEIGCVELLDRQLTGNHFHVYLNPEREVEEGAFKVHGISTEFLQDKPKFHDILNSFLQFVEGAELIIHNAPFDIGFLNAELNRVKWPKSIDMHCSVLDTLALAREKHPGQRNSLDALCKRYEIDNSNRTLHGALLDAEILAHVYLAMTGGQVSLFSADNTLGTEETIVEVALSTTLTSNSPIQDASPEEISKHEEFIQFIIEKSGVNHWS